MTKPGKFKIPDFPIIKGKGLTKPVAPKEPKKQLSRRERKNRVMHNLKFYGTWFLVIVFGLTSVALIMKPQGGPPPKTTAAGQATKAETQADIEYCQKQLESDSYNPEKICNLAYAYQKDVKLDEAINTYKLALKQDPKYGWALQHLAQTYAQKSKFPEAIAIYKQALQYKPDNTMLWEGLLAVYSQANMPQETAKTAAQLLKLDPGNLNAYTILAFNALKQSNKPQAKKYFQSALEIAQATGDYQKASMIQSIMQSMEKASSSNKLPPGVPPPPSKMGTMPQGQLPPGVPPPPGPPNIKPKPLEKK
jgi:tetratricopeptide (TPR) repeat protein